MESSFRIDAAFPPKRLEGLNLGLADGDEDDCWARQWDIRPIVSSACSAETRGFSSALARA